MGRLYGSAARLRCGLHPLDLVRFRLRCPWKINILCALLPTPLWPRPVLYGVPGGSIPGWDAIALLPKTYESEVNLAGALRMRRNYADLL